MLTAFWILYPQWLPVHSGSGALLRSHVWVRLTGQGGVRVPCFSLVTQPPVVPLSCLLWCFHSLLVEAELLGMKTAPQMGVPWGGPQVPTL